MGGILIGFIKKRIVLLIAIIAAAITCFFVPPDAEYLKYFDLRTLACLFCTLAVVAAFKNIHFFEILAQGIIKRFKNTRTAILALVFITYIASMILANDMALITFLPLSFFVLASCKKYKYLAYSFILQNIAANLGGMLTPFGNPQNLYLFSYYNISSGEFFRIMALPFAAALVLIFLCCVFIKKEPLEDFETHSFKLKPVRIALYTALFAVSVLIVFRVFPYYYGLATVVIGILILDRRAMLKVDYSLLLTFCAFFVFSSNLARIPYIKEFLSNLVNLSPLLVGIICCQLISNVPAAILLSKFTTDYSSLLVAVNIGGLGTPIASMASLITLNEYRKILPIINEQFLPNALSTTPPPLLNAPKYTTGKYLRLFLFTNFILLAQLTLFQFLFTL